MHPFLGSQKKEKEKEKNKDSRRHKLVHQTPTSLISSQSSKSFSVISCSEKKKKERKDRNTKISPRRPLAVRRRPDFHRASLAPPPLAPESALLMESVK
jgi:hypothetical protein